MTHPQKADARTGGPGAAKARSAHHETARDGVPQHVEGLLSRLKGVRPSGEDWTACCPAHDDQRPSLSVSVGNDGKVLVRCHAGCTAEAVVKAVGLTMADLFPRREQASRNGKARIVVSYDYRDEQGVLLFQAVRYEPKGFKQRRPKPDGGWKWSVKGVRVVPYRLPELLGDPDRTVFVPEGEKDCDNLAKAGLVATCNACGAEKWTAEHAAFLKDRNVVILPDNDGKGRKHAEQVARSLWGLAASVRVVELPGLPEKGDVSDWLEAGGTVEELRRLADEAKEWAPTGSSAGHDRDDGVPYRATPRGLVWDKPTKDGTVPVLLTNFNAKIISQVVFDDGAERRRAFEIEAQCADRKRVFSISASQFPGMNWPTEHLGASAIVWPGFGTRDHARAAIQLLSGDVATRIIYRHTGWRRIDDQWVYLHAGGALGPDGPLAEIETDLGALSRYVLPAPPKGEDLARAIKATLRLYDLDAERDRGMTVTWCATYRSVLGPCDFSIHKVGESGVGKSEDAALVQQHFGAEMDRLHLPANWSSTANSLEGLAHAAKDALLVIDDFAPSGTPTDVQRYHREAARLLRAQGNQQGRQRMTATAELRAVKPPRGLILSTGEDIPRDFSIRARTLIVNVDRPPKQWWDRLAACQRDGAAGLYASAMSAFIAWLAGRYEAEADRMRRRVLELRDEATSSDAHKRTAAIVADLAYGAERFAEFAVDVGALTRSEAAAVVKRCWEALGRAAKAQAEHHGSVDPARRFIELLRSAIVAGEAHLTDDQGDEPHHCSVWGWTQNSRSEWEPRGSRVGWLKGGAAYLDPDAAFRIVQKMDGMGLGLTPQTLWKRLRDRKLLASTDQQRDRVLVRVTLQGSRRSVLHLHTGHIMPQETAQPSQPSHYDENSRENGTVCWDGFSDDGQKPSHNNGPIPRENGTSGTVGTLGTVSGAIDSRTIDDGNWGEV